MRMESMVLHPRRLRTLVFGWPGWRDSKAVRRTWRTLWAEVEFPALTRSVKLRAARGLCYKKRCISLSLR